MHFIKSLLELQMHSPPYSLQNNDAPCCSRERALFPKALEQTAGLALLTYCICAHCCVSTSEQMQTQLSLLFLILSSNPSLPSSQNQSSRQVTLLRT